MIKDLQSRNHAVTQEYQTEQQKLTNARAQWSKDVQRLQSQNDTLANRLDAFDGGEFTRKDREMQDLMRSIDDKKVSGYHLGLSLTILGRTKVETFGNHIIYIYDIYS